MDSSRLEFGEKQRSSEPPELTPLIDVVFLLLLFFMLSSTLVRPDLFDVDLPESQADLDHSADPVTLLVGADGSWAVNDQRVDEAQLLDALRTELAAAVHAQLLIKADASVNTGQIIAALRRARSVGFEQISLATQRDAQR